MKIYLDKNKRVTGYEVTFYDPKGKVPNTNLDSGQEESTVFLNHEQNSFIQKYLQQGGKVTDLIFNGKFTESKQTLYPQVCGFNLHKTVLVDIQNFNPNYEITRHLKGIDAYVFEELLEIPLKKIDTTYLYDSDEFILKKVYAGELLRAKNKRYFGLFDHEELVAFILIVDVNNFPRLAVLYHNEKYSDGGYQILFHLINLLKKEGIKYFDLGGLTREDSGINQFKRKWGKEIFASEVSKIA